MIDIVIVDPVRIIHRGRVVRSIEELYYFLLPSCHATSDSLQYDSFKIVSAQMAYNGIRINSEITLVTMKLGGIPRY